MLRYVISFPGVISPETAQHFANMLRECADDPGWRDVVLSNGATITDMRRPHRHIPPAVRRARARRS